MLKHLLRQNLARARFEIVLVDDGSLDGSEQAIREIIERDAKMKAEGLNFRYIYFERMSDRKMGDCEFRAGIARNLGVKNSVGQILCFLDSDIVVGGNYLESLIELHKKNDVVQGKRHELTKEKSHEGTTYKDISIERDTYPVDQGHWDEFLSKKTVWNEISAGWEYTCSHSLSIAADYFKKVGWFRKTFIFYGYEDTELGFRLWRSGARFKLNDQEVFHLYHADERSEFGNSHDHKILLTKSAPTFYFHTLDDEVYDRLSYLFEISFNPLVYMKIFFQNWVQFFVYIQALLWTGTIVLSRPLKNLPLLFEASNAHKETVDLPPTDLVALRRKTLALLAGPLHFCLPVLRYVSFTFDEIYNQLLPKMIGYKRQKIVAVYNERYWKAHRLIGKKYVLYWKGKHACDGVRGVVKKKLSTSALKFQDSSGRVRSQFEKLTTL